MTELFLWPTLSMQCSNASNFLVVQAILLETCTVITSLSKQRSFTYSTKLWVRILFCKSIRKYAVHEKDWRNFNWCFKRLSVQTVGSATGGMKASLQRHHSSIFSCTALRTQEVNFIFLNLFNDYSNTRQELRKILKQYVKHIFI